MVRRQKAHESAPLSAHASAISSVVIGLGIIWIAISTIQAGGSQVYSVVGMFVALLFAVQGIRMSREPDARFPRFSLITSIVGILLGVVAFVLMAYAFTL
jgi:hypothetical protein